MSYSISHKTGIEACRILSGAPFLSSITRINADILNNAENRRNYTRDVAQEGASKRKTDAPSQSKGKARKNGICARTRAFSKKPPFSTAAFGVYIDSADVFRIKKSPDNIESSEDGIIFTKR